VTDDDTSEVCKQLNISPSTLRLFVEVLEEMKHKLDRIEENQKQLAAPTPEEPELDSPELSSQQPESESEPVIPKKDTRSLWARIWNK